MKILDFRYVNIIFINYLYRTRTMINGDLKIKGYKKEEDIRGDGRNVNTRK